MMRKSVIAIAVLPGAVLAGCSSTSSTGTPAVVQASTDIGAAVKQKCPNVQLQQQ